MDGFWKIRKISTLRRTFRRHASALRIYCAQIFRNPVAAIFCVSLLAGGTAWSTPGPPAYGGVQNAPSIPPTGWKNDRSQAAAQHIQPGRQGAEQHLAQWLRQHQNLSLGAQERALRKESGFNRLPSDTQKRLIDRLQQLNAMPPAQRERTLQWMEALEKLSPAQRQQIHAAMQQVGELPPARQRMLRKASRDLRQLPQEQRQAVLESSQFKGKFSDQEREILKTLMSAQPYVPTH